MVNDCTISKRNSWCYRETSSRQAAISEALSITTLGKSSSQRLPQIMGSSVLPVSEATSQNRSYKSVLNFRMCVGRSIFLAQ